jgi:hypothetical protein
MFSRRIRSLLALSPALPLALPLLPLLLLLSGCSNALGSSGQASGSEIATRIQGPTGDSLELRSVERESYLIPPEIPNALLTLIFNSVALGSEILEIDIVSASEARWVLDITTEDLSSGSATRRFTYLCIGEIWQRA